MTFLTPFEIALLAYVPGAVLFRAPILAPGRRATLPAEERAFWAVMLSIGFSCMAALALASLGWYRYDRLLSLNAGLSLLAIVGWRGALRFKEPAARPGWAALVPLALVALPLWLYGPPAEYVMGGKDPGTYVNAGIQIAQRGALEIRDPVVASVPREVRDLFFPPHNHPTYYSSRFMGFFVIDPDRGTVIDQFPHLFPVSIALGYGLNGLTGARQATMVWALLAMVAVYLMGARIFGRLPSAVGVLLLGLSVIEVWYSRYPNAEVMAQALLFAAMLAWSRAQIDDQPFFGPVAASLLGMLLFLRFDMVLALGGFVGAAALGRAAGHRPVVGFFATLTLWAAAAALYLFGLMQPYMALPIVFVTNLPAWQLAAIGVLALAALALLAGAARMPVMRRLLPWLPPVVLGLALVAGAYAYFFRQAGGRITDYDAMALRSFAWYVTPIGLAAAFVGYAAAVRRWLTRDSVFLLTLTIYSAFFFYKIRIVPEHFWMTRRFLPIILPGALLLVSYALLGRWWSVTADVSPRARWFDRARFTAGTLIAVVLAAALWTQSRPLFAHVEYAGLIPRMEALAAKFTERDLVIVESRDASDVHVLAMPLAYIYARNVLVLPNRRPDNAQFKTFLDWAGRHYERIFFMGGGGTDLLSRDIAVEPVDTFVFQIPEWESRWNALPTGLRHKEFDFSLYRFVAPAAPGAVTTGPTMAFGPATTTTPAIALDLGVNDDLNVLRFHAKERHANGTTFRWSRDVSYINLVGIPAGARTLTFVADDGRRPEQVKRAAVGVTLNGHDLGSVTVGPDFQTYTLMIPAEVAAEAAGRHAPSRLAFTTNVWKPREVIGVADDRDLGVMIDRVEVR